MKKLIMIALVSCSLVGTNAYALTTQPAPSFSDLLSQSQKAVDRGDTGKEEEFLKSAALVASIVQDHDAYVVAMNALAQLYADKGLSVAAESTYRQCIQYIEDKRGQSDSILGEEYCKLAAFYASQDKAELAQDANSRGLQVFKQTLPAGSMTLAVAQHNQAWLELQLCNLNEAEKQYRAALATFKLSGKRNQIMVGLTANSLAELLVDENKLAEAETTYREAVKVLVKNLKVRHLLGTIINNYISVLTENKKNSEAARVRLSYKALLHH